MGKKEVIYNIQGFEDPINGYVEDMSEEAERANSTEENRYTYIANCAAVVKRKGIQYGFLNFHNRKYQNLNIYITMVRV